MADEDEAAWTKKDVIAQVRLIEDRHERDLPLLTELELLEDMLEEIL